MSYLLPASRGNCPTGKWEYASRKQARHARTRYHQDHTLRAYRCDQCGFFHLGHQPQVVRRGTYDKAAWLAGKGSK